MSSLLATLFYGLNISTLLLLAIILVLSYILLNWSRFNKNLPPGPKGLPLVGYAPYLDKNKPLWMLAKELSEEYNSDIIYLSILGTGFVFLNSYELMKEAFLRREDFADKPVKSAVKMVDPEYQGVLDSSGPLWKSQRRFTLSLLRDFGMGKAQAENNIHEEVDYLLERITAVKGESFDPLDMLVPSITNIICLTIFGHRFEYDDKEFSDTLQAVDKLLSVTSQEHMRYLTTPYVGWMAKYLNSDAEQVLRENYIFFCDFICKQIREHVDAFDDTVNDFIDGFLAERKKRLDDDDTGFSMKQLQCLVTDLFFAGSDTTTNSLRWAILFLMKYPERQEEIYQELLETIGLERPSSMTDKKNTPITESFLLELQRFNTVGPLGTPHSCSSSGDTELSGYTIPHDAIVFGNIGAMHHDARNFPEEPDVFKPERFLKNGKVANTDKMFQFGIGRRSCAGEGLARMEIYLIFTSLVLRYRFEKVGKEELDLMGVESATWAPKHYKTSAISRN